MDDYTICYKSNLSVDADWEDRWDIFLSGFAPTDRSRAVFDKVVATEKHWIAFPEYGFTESELPSGNVFRDDPGDEASFVTAFLDPLLKGSASAKLCIDITAFIRPYLLFLVRLLTERGIRKFDAIYAEPIRYSSGARTCFSGDAVREVRQVAGYEGAHVPETTHDLLVIGSGYEDQLISHVAENKAKAKKIQLLGFPSLRADMFQENVLRVRLAEESLGGMVDNDQHAIYAPANDPFVAAQELKRLIAKQEYVTNLYLCPLSTHPHVLGFALYYIYELRNTASSIIYPFEQTHSKRTSEGVSRIWKYEVELPGHTKEI